MQNFESKRQIETSKEGFRMRGLTVLRMIGLVIGLLFLTGVPLDADHQVWGHNPAGTQIFTIQDVTQVGIGTGMNINPFAKVHVLEGNPGLFSSIFLEHSLGALLRMYGGPVEGSIGTTNAFPLHLITNNFARLVIDPAGRVGIGTTSPAFPLEVNSGATDMAIAIRGTGNNMGLQILNNAPGGRLYSIHSTGGGSGWGQGRFVIADSTPGQPPGAVGARLVIDPTGNVLIPTGNVLIGTTVAEATRLAVRGAGNTSATKALEVVNSGGTYGMAIYDDGKACIGSCPPNARLFVWHNHATEPALMVQNIGAGNAADFFGNVRISSFLQLTGSTLPTTSPANTFRLIANPGGIPMISQNGAAYEAVQLEVDDCPPGQAIQTVAQDGTVTCVSTGAATSPWVRVGAVIQEVNPADDVIIGAPAESSTGGKLEIVGKGRPPASTPPAQTPRALDVFDVGRISYFTLYDSHQVLVNRHLIGRLVGTPNFPTVSDPIPSPEPTIFHAVLDDWPGVTPGFVLADWPLDPIPPLRFDDSIAGFFEAFGEGEPEQKDEGPREEAGHGVLGVSANANGVIGYTFKGTGVLGAAVRRTEKDNLNHSIGVRGIAGWDGEVSSIPLPAPRRAIDLGPAAPQPYYALPGLFECSQPPNLPTPGRVGPTVPPQNMAVEVWNAFLLGPRPAINLLRTRDLLFAIDCDGDVWARGIILAQGGKGFVQDHPTDSTKQIVYISLEGPEAGTYIRGTAQLVNGEAVINLPEHFSLVSNDEGLTVQLTPLGEWLQLYVVKKNTKQIIVREASGKSGQFDYLVQGVRKGYENHQVIQEKGK